MSTGPSSGLNIMRVAYITTKVGFKVSVLEFYLQKECKRNPCLKIEKQYEDGFFLIVCLNVSID